jgi:hypothetical protein
VKRLTKDNINSRLAEYGIQLVGEYTVSSKNAEFICDKGHAFSAKPNNILTRLRCAVCYDNKTPRTVDEINALLKHRGIQMTGNYMGYRVNNSFTAICGHSWQATAKNVLSKTGCPYCAIKAFTSNRPAVVYVLEFDTFMKYGISNNIDRRLMEHNVQNGKNRLVFSKEFSDGAEALRIEKHIKKKFGGKFVSKDRCPNGHTETLALTMIQDVINTIESGVI